MTNTSYQKLTKAELVALLASQNPAEPAPQEPAEPAPASNLPDFDVADFHARLMAAGSGESMAGVIFDCCAGRRVPAEIVESEISALKAAKKWTDKKGDLLDWRYTEVAALRMAGPHLADWKKEAEALYLDVDRHGNAVALVKAAAKKLHSEPDATDPAAIIGALALTKEYGLIPPHIAARNRINKALKAIADDMDAAELDAETEEKAQSALIDAISVRLAV